MNKADHGDGHQHTDPGSSCCSCHCSQPTPLSQDLDELEFERSILGAAARGSAKQTAALIKRGRHKDRDARFDLERGKKKKKGRWVDKDHKPRAISNLTECSRCSRGYNALHFAARAGSEDVVRLLLQTGDLNVNETTRAGFG